LTHYRIRPTLKSAFTNAQPATMKCASPFGQTTSWLEWLSTFHLDRILEVPIPWGVGTFLLEQPRRALLDAARFTHGCHSIRDDFRQFNYRLAKRRMLRERAKLTFRPLKQGPIEASRLAMRNFVVPVIMTRLPSIYLVVDGGASDDKLQKCLRL